MGGIARELTRGDDEAGPGPRGVPKRELSPEGEFHIT